MTDAATRSRILDLLPSLPYPEQRILRLRFRPNGLPPVPLHEAGDEYGWSREQVRALECRVLSMVRHPSSQTGS